MFRNPTARRSRTASPVLMAPVAASPTKVSPVVAGTGCRDADNTWAATSTQSCAARLRLSEHKHVLQVFIRRKHRRRGRPPFSEARKAMGQRFQFAQHHRTIHARLR